MQSLSKRTLVAESASRIGLLSILERLPRRNALIVLNYHRIGDLSATPYDSGVFSATQDTLDRQIGYLKNHFRMATLHDVIEIVQSPAKLRGTIVLITFDDGYADNHQLAFPILRSHGVQGVFFLPTAAIGSSAISWWDAVAFMVKSSARSKLRLSYPDIEFDKTAQPVNLVTREILALYKQVSNGDTRRFMDSLSDACEVPVPTSAPDLTMDWEAAAQLLKNGMAIGSHTHTHSILSKLDDRQQLYELVESKRILESRLGVPIEALSYPVGLRDCFTEATKQLANEAGYKVAFSFYGGVNRGPIFDPYDICRMGIDIDHTFSHFRLNAALGGLVSSPKDL